MLWRKMYTMQIFVKNILTIVKTEIEISKTIKIFTTCSILTSRKVSSKNLACAVSISCDDVKLGEMHAMPIWPRNAYADSAKKETANGVKIV